MNEQWLEKSTFSTKEMCMIHIPRMRCILRKEQRGYQALISGKPVDFVSVEVKYQAEILFHWFVIELITLNKDKAQTFGGVVTFYFYF